MCEQQHTFALAACPCFDLSATRDTLVAVSFAVRAAYWFVFLCAKTRACVIGRHMRMTMQRRIQHEKNKRNLHVDLARMLA